jgi:hypothetical protein
MIASARFAHGRRDPFGSCFNKYANMSKHIATNMRRMISLFFWRNAVYWISGGVDYLPRSLSLCHSSLSCQINRFPASMPHPHRALPLRYSRITSDRCCIRCALSFQQGSSSRWICRCFFSISYLSSKRIINDNEKCCSMYCSLDFSFFSRMAIKNFPELRYRQYFSYLNFNLCLILDI